MKPQGVTIIICCHNGANRLPETIRHIARQRVPAYIPWELLIIDNGSTDDSGLVARLEWQKHRVSTPMRVVNEPALGLSHARARGFKEAQYEYMVLCDDDNWLESDYVATAHAILSGNSNIGALGGLGKLVYEGAPPSPALSFIFAAGKQAPQTGSVPSNSVYGAGCVIRYAAYEQLLATGFETMLTDRCGVQLTSGGDYELCLALAILGFDIWYDERLRFTHYITCERLSWNYFLRYASESSQGFNVLTSYKMIATRAWGSGMPWILILKNFLISAKEFASINIRRLARRKQDDGRLLYFRHLLFKYKLIAYLLKYRGMVTAHRRILEFARRCRPVPQVQRSIGRKDYIPSFRLSFFSKPLRLLR